MIDPRRFSLASLFCAALVQPASAESTPNGWQRMIAACVAYVRTGGLPDARDWRLSGMAIKARQFAHRELPVEIVLQAMPSKRRAHLVACEMSRDTVIRGNDAAGLSLRAQAHAVLDPILAFRDADQNGPPDVWRGCARDGQEFRLKSMTQTTYASFWIILSPRDPACSLLGA